MNVKTILATKGRSVVTIQPNRTIKEAVILMAQHNIGALVVVGDDQQIIGILSERDITRRSAERDDVLAHQVRDVMTHNVFTGMPQDDLHSVANVMTERRIRHLPILDRGKLVGIVSIGDVVKIQRDLYKGEVDTLQTQLLADKA
jgi:CBS domain-containing protein